MNTAVLAKSHQVHKFVANITTDGDMEIIDKDSGESSAALIMEWVGESREDVVNQAKEYLSNRDNYCSEFAPEDCDLFIENYVVVAFGVIGSGAANFWSSRESYEVDFTYMAPEM